jgi:hypothetical protein
MPPPAAGSRPRSDEEIADPPAFERTDRFNAQAGALGEILPGQVGG